MTLAGSPQPQSPTKNQYQRLTSRLEKLGYSDAVPIDAMPIVLKLLNDLVQTTDSCRRLKLDNDKYMQDRKRTEGRMEPLKQEIAQMTKENNMLHLHLINAADARDEREKKAQLALRKYQNEIADLQFVNRQLVAKMDGDHRRAESERTRLAQVLDLMGAGVGVEIDSLALRRGVPSTLNNHLPRVDIDDHLAPVSSDIKSRFPPVELHAVDLVKLADSNIAKLKDELASLTLRNNELVSQIQNFEEQISTRDSEISRLGSLLESERNHAVRVDGPSVLGGIGDYIKSSRMEHVENQLNYLSECLADVEKEKIELEKEKSLLHAESQEKLSALTAELEDVYRKNDSLCQDLKHLEKLIADYERMQNRLPVKKAHVASKGKANVQSSRPLPPTRVAEIYDELNRTRRDLQLKSKSLV
eukprot:Partr_v1_DN28823_c1_g1_i1_m33374 putative centrosomal protein 135kDa